MTFRLHDSLMAHSPDKERIHKHSRRMRQHECVENFTCCSVIVTSVQRCHCICRVQQLMLSNTAVKIGALLLFALPAVLVFGEIYSGITGQPATNGFVKIYSVLLMIPGTSTFLTFTPSFCVADCSVTLPLLLRCSAAPISHFSLALAGTSRGASNSHPKAQQARPFQQQR